MARALLAITGRISSLFVAPAQLTRDNFEDSSSNQSLGGTSAGDPSRNLPGSSSTRSGGTCSRNHCRADGCSRGDSFVSSQGTCARGTCNDPSGWSLHLLRGELSRHERPSGLPDGKLLSGTGLRSGLQTDQTASAQTRLALHFSVPVLVLLCPMWQAQARTAIPD